MRKLLIGTFSAVALLALACGGGNSVSGSVQGHSMSAKDAIFLSSTAGNNSGITVLIADHSGLCQAQNNPNVQFKNANALILSVLNPDAGVTYADDQMHASGSFFSSDQNCVVGAPVNSDAGTIKIASISSLTSGSVGGSFDLMFGTDHLTGNFNANYCAPNTDAGTASADGGTCQ